MASKSEGITEAESVERSALMHFAFEDFVVAAEGIGGEKISMRMTLWSARRRCSARSWPTKPPAPVIAIFMVVVGVCSEIGNVGAKYSSDTCIKEERQWLYMRLFLPRVWVWVSKGGVVGHKVLSERRPRESGTILSRELEVISAVGKHSSNPSN
jgi:hypothetical protein